MAAVKQSQLAKHVLLDAAVVWDELSRQAAQKTTHHELSTKCNAVEGLGFRGRGLDFRV